MRVASRLALVTQTLPGSGYFIRSPGLSLVCKVSVLERGPPSEIPPPHPKKSCIDGAHSMVRGRNGHKLEVPQELVVMNEFTLAPVDHNLSGSLEVVAVETYCVNLAVLTA
jgi:hypothetical protein